MFVHSSIQDSRSQHSLLQQPQESQVSRDEGREGLDLWNHLVQHHHSCCGLLARRVRLHRRRRVDDGDKISLQPPPMQDPDSEQQGRTTPAIAIFDIGGPAPVATQ